MKVADLSPEILAKIKPVQWDRILEKHEGPEDWAGEFRYGNPEFLMVEGHPVLLPVDQSQHPNITILRTIFSRDGNSLTLFLQDTTHGTDWYSSGYMAVCDKVAGESFFLAILYHEWFVIEGSPVFQAP
jgi:hypothetical protein